MNFNTRLAEALANGLERERANEEVVAYAEIDDDDMDLTYMPDVEMHLNYIRCRSR